jgi:hypothetical protein
MSENISDQHQVGLDDLTRGRVTMVGRSSRLHPSGNGIYSITVLGCGGIAFTLISKLDVFVLPAPHLPLHGCLPS